MTGFGVGAVPYVGGRLAVSLSSAQPLPGVPGRQNDSRLKATGLVGLANQRASTDFKILDLKIYAAWKKYFSELLFAAVLSSPVVPSLLLPREQCLPAAL